MFKKVVAAVEILALLATGVFVVLLAFASPSGTAPAGGGGTGGGATYLPETGALAADGKALYAARCAGCHGSDGGGGSGPRLAGRVTDRFPDIEDEIAVVKKGRGGMPALGGSLSDGEIRQVVEYTRTDLGS